MLKIDQINEIHRLAGGEHWSVRRIAGQLHLAARTVKKYLQAPVPSPVHRPRPSKLDPFQPLVAELLAQDPDAPGVVILQRLRAAGYAGGHTILDGYLHRVRPSRSTPRAFVRMEPGPGERFEIDWGHFDSLDYQGDKRKLYAFCLIEAHSRMLYVEFTHSQSFETFVRCHQHAFQALGGVARECWFDNLLTAVAEHDGRLVRFQPRFLAFAREYDFYPRACNPGAGWEKGKVEKGGVAYLRSNFWPLRSFTDLADVNRQVRQWLDDVANVRLHRETRQRPCERFRPDTLRPLPALAPDYRDTAEVFVYKDLRWHFDANRYYAPPRFVTQHLMAKADSSSLTLYDRQGVEIVRYPRCWRRGQNIGAGRFEKELLERRPAARRSQVRRSLPAGNGRSLSARAGRLRPFAPPPASGTPRSVPRLSPPTGRRGPPKSSCRPRFRRRLRGPSLTPNRVPTPASAPLAVARSGTQSTHHRPVVLARLRCPHFESPKGVFR